MFCNVFSSIGNFYNWFFSKNKFATHMQEGKLLQSYIEKFASTAELQTFILILVGDLCNFKFWDDNSGMILIFQLLICQHQSSQLNGMPLPTVWCVVEIEIHNRQFSWTSHKVWTADSRVFVALMNSWSCYYQPALYTFHHHGGQKISSTSSLFTEIRWDKISRP